MTERYECGVCGLPYFSEERRAACEQDHWRERFGELRFYYGLEGSGTDQKLPHVEHIFISAASLWNDGKERFDYPSLPSHEWFMLDSGGFSFFTKYDEYPYSPEDLAGLARSIRPDYVATMDFPCEPEVLDKHDSSVEEQIRRSIDLAEKCVDHRIPGQWLPVIQGYEPEDYLSCIDRMEDRGLLRPYMAVGSVCVRDDVEEMTEIIQAVSDRLPGTRLHFFGLSLNALKVHENYREMYSTDSTAWKWNRRRYEERDGHERTTAMPKNEDEKLRNFPYYRETVEGIKDGYTGQIGLDAVTGRGSG